MRIRTDDGVEIEAEVAGSGPALVLVHGLGGAKEDFADHVEALAESHTVVVFDQRGHGASGKPEALSAYSLDRLAEDLAAVIDAVGLERVRLLGHSMGGMSVRRYTIANPERVEAVVFMDTCAGPIRGWDVDVLEIAVGVALEEGKDALKELLDAFSPLNNPAYDRLVAERPGYQEFMDRKWEDLSAVAWAGLMRSIANQPDDRLAVAELEIPTLVLVGALDDAFLEPCKEIGRLVADARTAVLDGAGHSPQMENAPAWLGELQSFLRSLDPAESLDAFGV